MSLIAELKRRNVLRMAAAYCAGSWLLLQIVDTVLPAFETDANILRYLVIALSIGFIPAMAVSWAFEWTPEGLKRDEEVAVGKNEESRAQTRTWDRIILVIMALALGLFAVDRFVLQPQRDVELIEAATEAGAEQERNKAPEFAHESVAVIPFANLSADPDNEYFSDGLTETLLHMLAQLDDLQVAARTSSFAFKDRNMDVVDIASQLRVAHILEGSVQKMNNRIRVTAQLVRGEDGYQLWTKRYDGNLDDIFAIQDEIAVNVADALGSTLLANNSDAIQGVFTEDVSAYDLYLRALENQATGTFAALEEAEGHLFAALEQDSEFVDAKIGLIRNAFLKMYLSTGSFTDDVLSREGELKDLLASHPDNLVAQQYDLRLRSIQAANDADLLLSDDLMNQLAASFESGIGDPLVRADASYFLVGEGRMEEAEQLLQDGLARDPLNIDLLLAKAYAVAQLRGLDAAEIPLNTAYSVQPDNPRVLRGLFLLENRRQNIVAGLRWARRLEIADPTDIESTTEIALALNEVGLFEEAARWLEHYRSRETDPGEVALRELLFAMEIGDDETLEQLVPVSLERILRGDYPSHGLRRFLIEYVNIMRREGRSQEALDYLESFYPGISNITEGPIDDWMVHDIQLGAVLHFLKDVSDEETAAQARETLLKNREAEGMTIGAVGHIRLQTERHGVEAGKDAFFRRFNDDTYVLLWLYRDFRRYNWAAELRKHPEIIEHYRLRQEKVDKLREEIIELLKEPEWSIALD